MTGRHPLPPPRVSPRVPDPAAPPRLLAACEALAPAAAPRAAAELLAALIETTGAARGSILALNPATGRLAITAALGLRAGLLGQELPPRPRSISEWVFRQRRSLTLNGEVRDERFEGSAAAEHIESALSLPLVSGDQPVGVLNLARLAPAPVFSEAEREALEARLEPVAEALARLLRVSATLAAGSRYAAGSCASGGSFLPCGLSELRHYELALAHRRAIVPAGDLCDRIPHPGGDHTLVVFDPPGRGATAAATGSFLQGLLVALASPERSAAGMAARLGSEVHHRLGPDHSTAAWLAQLSPHGELCYCNAGHAWPLWVPADGSEVVRLDRGGPLLGALPAAPYEEERLRLLPGDVVLVASDGVLDARGPADQPFGIARLAEMAPALLRRPLGHIAESVIESVIEFSGRPLPTDDLTVLALRFHARD